MNHDLIELAEGHTLQKGLVYVLKMPRFENEGAVPYPSSMFQHHLPEGHRFVVATGPRTFEFKEFTTRKADTVRDFRGHAQAYEENNGRLPSRRIQPGAVAHSDFINENGEQVDGLSTVRQQSRKKADTLSLDK